MSLDSEKTKQSHLCGAAELLDPDEREDLSLMDEHTLRKQVNASGFAFQLRVEHEVRASSDRHRWYPVAREHRWVNVESGSEGFIDLVLQKQGWGYPAYMVIECKRARGGSWVFLATDTDDQTSNASILVSSDESEGLPTLLWSDLSPYPTSLVSSFCAVPGQADKGTPMLERICSELLDSIETLSTDHAALSSRSPATGPGIRAYFVPVVVTNTELVVVHFDPEEVDLAKGELDESQGTFESVPFIRFQKSFHTRFVTDRVPTDLRQANRENQRTVFIVRALNLPDFLRRWDV